MISRMCCGMLSMQWIEAEAGKLFCFPWCQNTGVWVWGAVLFPMISHSRNIYWCLQLLCCQWQNTGVGTGSCFVFMISHSRSTYVHCCCYVAVRTVACEPGSCFVFLDPIYCIATTSPKIILLSTLESGQCHGQQRKCWIVDVKKRTPLAMPELLMMASRRKDWKRICAELSVMSPLMTWSVEGLNWTDTLAATPTWSWHVL